MKHDISLRKPATSERHLSAMDSQTRNFLINPLVPENLRNLPNSSKLTLSSQSQSLSPFLYQLTA
jgi:hypothetical protein